MQARSCRSAPAAGAALALLAALLLCRGAAARRVLATAPYTVRGGLSVLSSSGAKAAKADVGGSIIINWQLLDGNG